MNDASESSGGSFAARSRLLPGAACAKKQEQGFMRSSSDGAIGGRTGQGGDEEPYGPVVCAEPTCTGGNPPAMNAKQKVEASISLRGTWTLFKPEVARHSW